MRRTLKIASYLMFVSVITAMGIWFCKSEIFTPVHNYLFGFGIFQVFRGNREFVINLLMGICTSVLFASFGFYIDYFEKKRGSEEKLLHFYKTIRNRCFERLFYEQNSYDDDPDEVAEICDFLNNYLEVIKDYRPPLLLARVKLHKLFHRPKKQGTEGTKKTISSLSNYITLTKYADEDKYALIGSVFGEVYKYFGFINMVQSSIQESKRIISLCERKLERAQDLDENPYLYESFLENAKKQHSVFERRLKARYPYNTKEYQQFVDKKELYSKFYAIDNHFSEEFFHDYGAAVLMLEDCIVEDINVLYSTSDECIKL